MMVVAVQGNPFDGMRIIGPFDDAEDAAEWAEGDNNCLDWWIVKVEEVVWRARRTAGT